MKRATQDFRGESGRMITALVHTIREAEQKLQKLTGGQVDAVVGAGGQAYLLHDAQEKLRESELAQRQLAKLQSTILDALPSQVALLDSAGVIIAVNAAWLRFLGENTMQVSDSPVGQNYLELCEQAEGEDAQDAHQVAAGLRQVLSGEVKEYALEYPCDAPNEPRWYRVIVTPLKEDQVAGAVVTHINITVRKLAELKTLRLNRVYALLSQINSAIVRIRDRLELFENACQIAVKTGGFRAAWVGLVEEQSGNVCPIAKAGEIEGYLEMAGISTSPGLEWNGPSGTVIRELRPVICNDIEGESDAALWREPALLRGYRSVAAFPLLSAGRLFGAFVLYAENKNFFDALEIQLLEELAADISFAVEFIEKSVHHREAEIALSASETRYRSLATATSQIVWTTDATGQVPGPLPEWQNFTGQSLEEVQGDGWARAIHPDDVERTLQVWYGAVAGNMMYDTEYRLQRHDGLYRDFSVRGVPVLTPDGSIKEWVGCCMDITERKRAEERLLERDKLLNLAGRLTRTGGWYMDVSSRQVFWSDLVCDIMECPHGYAPVLSDALALHPETSRDSVAAAVDACVRDGSAFDLETEILTTQGRRMWGRVCGEAQLGTDSKILKVWGAFQDITERKKTEERLVEQAALLDIAHEAIMVKDLEDRIIYWNKGAERIYGWTSEDALGRKSTELLHSDHVKFQDAYASLLTRGEWQGELGKQARDGRKLTVDVRWTLVRDQKGNPKSILAINSDVTDRKKLEQQFLRAQRMESIGTLAGGIAHDLNNVLAPIMMSIALLEMKFPDDQAKEILRTLQTSTKHGADLVKQVLSFARGVEGERIDVNLLHLAHDIQKTVRDTFPKSVAFDLDAKRDLWLVTGDPTQLHQVLLNFCVNARDAMPNGGQLTISLENIVLDDTYAAMSAEAHPGAYVALQVADTGTGIPPDIRDKIFEPFFTTKEIGKGTGLGLSTTIGIVKSHGGFINLYSEMGKGTKFKVYLPAKTTTAAADKVAVEQTRLPRGNGELVLLVDDEEAIRKTAKSTLERFGYRVVLAANGAEAVALYARQEQEISVILTDMAMPIMDGPTMIVALQSINPQVRIIGSSGLASNGGVAKAIGAGVQHFIPKPYTAEAILKKLREVLGATQQAN